MENLKSFNEFIKENYLENPSDAELLDNSKKKMLKNGYVEVEVIEPVDGLEKGDTVMVSATEFGELEDESMVTCYKGDDKIITAKRNLQVKMK